MNSLLPSPIQLAVLAVLVGLFVVWRRVHADPPSTPREVPGGMPEVRPTTSAQRFDWIGPIASGVATEMTTPLQYMSDNAVFLQESFTSLLTTCDGLAALARRTDPDAVEDYLAQADMEFLRAEVPGALRQTQEGLGAIRDTVGAMMSSLNLGVELADVDLNRLISNAVTVSRSEWADVATVEPRFDGRLRNVRGHADQINHMILHLIVHAARSIRATVSGMGVLAIDTSVVGDHARLTFRHTGPARIGHPGTVHDLASVNQIVAVHDGTMAIDSDQHPGTTTISIELPIDGAQASRERERQ